MDCASLAVVPLRRLSGSRTLHAGCLADPAQTLHAASGEFAFVGSTDASRLLTDLLQADEREGGRAGGATRLWTTHSTANRFYCCFLPYRARYYPYFACAHCHHRSDRHRQPAEPRGRHSTDNQTRPVLATATPRLYVLAFCPFPDRTCFRLCVSVFANRW